MPHKHELAATWMMKVLDYDTLNVGCHECGTQWVVTVNWADHTLMIAWTNAPWSLYFDADTRQLTVDSHHGEGLDDAAG